MHFTRCTSQNVEDAVAKACADGGYELAFSPTSWSGRSFRGRILPTSSYVKGARRSPSGRRLRVACWHAHRDVLAALFDAVPDAKVSTALATYDGRTDFKYKFVYTYETPTSAGGQTLQYGGLCDCEE